MTASLVEGTLDEFRCCVGLVLNQEEKLAEYLGAAGVQTTSQASQDELTRACHLTRVQWAQAEKFWAAKRDCTPMPDSLQKEEAADVRLLMLQIPAPDLLIATSLSGLEVVRTSFHVDNTVYDLRERLAIAMQVRPRSLTVLRLGREMGDAETIRDANSICVKQSQLLSFFDGLGEDPLKLGDSLIEGFLADCLEKTLMMTGQSEDDWAETFLIEHVRPPDQDAIACLQEGNRLVCGFHAVYFELLSGREAFLCECILFSDDAPIDQIRKIEYLAMLQRIRLIHAPYDRRTVGNMCRSNDGVTVVAVTCTQSKRIDDELFCAGRCILLHPTDTEMWCTLQRQGKGIVETVTETTVTVRFLSEPGTQGAVWESPLLVDCTRPHGLWPTHYRIKPRGEWDMGCLLDLVLQDNHADPLLDALPRRTRESLQWLREPIRRNTVDYVGRMALRALGAASLQDVVQFGLSSRFVEMLGLKLGPRRQATCVLQAMLASEPAPMPIRMAQRIDEFAAFFEAVKWDLNSEWAQTTLNMLLRLGISSMADLLRLDLVDLFFAELRSAGALTDIAHVHAKAIFFHRWQR